MFARRFGACFGFLVLVGLLATAVAPSRQLIAGQEKKEEPKKDTPKEEIKKEEVKKDDPPPKKKGGKKKEITKEEPKKVDPPQPEEPVDPIKAAEKMLAEGKIKADAAGLTEYFKFRTLSETDRKNLAELIAKLGSDDFDTREDASNQLNRAGLAALPILRAATKYNDEEITRRIERALKTLSQENESGRVSAAALILANLKAEGTVRILLDYMPCTLDDETVQEGLRNALMHHCKLLGKADPLLVDALSAKTVELRTMAAQVLGEAVPEMRPAVKKLLEDKEPKVRYFAGLTLARHGDKTVIPEMLKLFEDGPLEYAYLTEDLMFQLLGDGKMTTTLSGGDAANRKKCREEWTTWWKANEGKAELAKLTSGESLKGLNIIIEVDQFSDGKGGQGRIWECGADGKQRWEWTNVNGPVDLQVLPGGRFLVAEYYNSYVTERDREGKILWTSPRQNSNTVACQRLPNGNTLIATMQEVVEIKKDGTRVGDAFPHPQGTVYHARRAKNGHTFILAGNELAEYDNDRKEVRKVTIPGGLSGWGGFDFLPNGNFVVGYYGSGRKYAEIDGKGKAVFEHVVPMDPSRVQRLRSGNILVAGGNTMICAEYDRDKKEVWKVTTKGRPFSIIRY